MPLKIKCPEGHELIVPTQRAGMRVRCPVCKSTVVVPKIDPAVLAERKKRLQEKRASQSATPDQSSEKAATATTKATTPAAEEPAQQRNPEGTPAAKNLASEERQPQVTEEDKDRPDTPAPELESAKEQLTPHAPSHGSEKTDSVEESPQTAKTPPSKEAISNEEESPAPRHGKPKSSESKPISKAAGEQPVRHVKREKATPPLHRPKDSPKDEKRKQEKQFSPDEKRRGEKDSAEKKEGSSKSPTKSPPPLKKPESQEKTSGTTSPQRVAVPPPKPTRPSKEQPSAPAKSEQKKAARATPDRAEKPSGPPSLPGPGPAKERPVRADSSTGESRLGAKPKLKPSKPAKPQKPAEPKPQVRGVEHDRSKKWTVYYLGVALALIGLLTILPGLLDVINANSGEATRRVWTWAYGTIFIGLVQLLYVVYLVQVPDWSSVWVVSILNLAITTFYATMMGLLFMGDQGSPILLSLDLALIRKKALIWCVSMLSISGLLTYLAGRIGIRWRKTYKLTVAAKEGAPS